MKKKTLNEINIGDKSVFSKTITEADIFAFTGISGDFNPLHVSEQFARTSQFKGRIAHGMLVAGLIDNTLADLAGLGAIHISQSVRFKAPVKIGDTVMVESVIIAVNLEKHRFHVQSTLTNQDETVVLTGEGELMLPQ
jgi:3-hydroxybutyryl-CoA dehydratase